MSNGLARAAALCLLIALATPASARDPPRKTFTTFGAASCAKWVATQTKDKSAPSDLGNSFALFEMKGWIYGYLTGITEALFATGNKDPLAQVDGQTIYDWMDNYCAKHPDAGIKDGAVELLLTLGKLPAK
jgi:hypothetical protein